MFGFLRGFFFSLLAFLQDCYPFSQEVALEHAVELGTAQRAVAKATGRICDSHQFAMKGRWPFF